MSEVLRLSLAITMSEDATANAAFPDKRLGRVTLKLTDGRELNSDHVIPKWDPLAPPTEAELRAKYHAQADPLLGQSRADAIESSLQTLPKTGLAPLYALLTDPISRDTMPPNAS